MLCVRACQRTKIPVRGLKLIIKDLVDNTIRRQRTKIPVRGLKQRPTNLNKYSSIVSQRTKIPVRGLKQQHANALADSFKFVSVPKSP